MINRLKLLNSCTREQREVGFEFLSAVVMKSSSPLKVNGHCGGTCHAHLQGRRVGEGRTQREADGKQSSDSLNNNAIIPVLRFYRHLTALPLRHLFQVYVRSGQC
jgi:hypothetical protein